MALFDRVRKGVKRKKAEAKAKKNKRQRDRERRRGEFRQKLEAIEDVGGDIKEIAGSTRTAGVARAATRGGRKAAVAGKKVTEQTRRDVETAREKLSGLELDLPAADMDSPDGTDLMGEPPPAPDPVEMGGLGRDGEGDLGLDAGEESLGDGLPAMDLSEDDT